MAVRFIGQTGGINFGCGALSSERPRCQTKGLDMNKALDEFVHHQNVANYTRQLRIAPDAGRRSMLMSLLAEERSRARSNGWNPLQA